MSTDPTNEFVLDKYTIEQIKTIVNSNDEWPSDIHEWMMDQMAHEVFDNWVNNHDDEDFINLANELLEMYEDHKN